MKTTLVLLFSVWCGTLMSQPVLRGPYTTNAITGRVVINPTDSADTITNKIGQMPFGWTAEFQPKTGPYVIPTLTFSMLRSNWNFFLPPGNHLAIGVDSDATERPAFSDSSTFAGTETSTNNILAWGATITVSNRTCHPFEVTRAGSVVNLYCHDLRRTYTSSGRACLKQTHGRFSWFITGLVTNGGYDGYWAVPNATALWTSGYANRIDVADTAIEFSGGVYPGHAVLVVNHARGGAGSAVVVASNVVVRGGLLEAAPGGTVGSTGAETGPAGILDVREIRALVMPTGLTPLRVVGAKIIGEVQTEGITGEDHVILENVEIEAPAGSTFSISSFFGLGHATIIGGFKANKPIDRANIVVTSPHVAGHVTKTSTYTVTEADAALTFNNIGTTARVDFNLPTPHIGLGPYCFLVQDADGIRLDPPAGVTIRNLATVTAAGATLTSTTVGSTITIMGLSATEYYAVSSLGTWVTP